MDKPLQVDYRIHAPVELAARLEVRGFTTLLGRSGIGKTTLLKAVAGLIPAAGAPFEGLPPEKRPIGYMPQSYALFPHLSAIENVAFPLLALPRQTRLGQAATLLLQMGLSKELHHLPSQLSDGQQQRVALARALARQPKLLLLDEPTSALDTFTREEVMHDVIDRLRQTGIPTLAASHDTALAQLSDHLAVLTEEGVAQQGSPEEVFAHPVSRAVARLVGLADTFPGKVVRTSGPWVDIDTAAGELVARDVKDLTPGETVYWGIRKEEIRLVRVGRTQCGEASENLIDGRIVKLLPRGLSTELRFEGPISLSLTVPRHQRERLALIPHTDVQIALDPRFVHLMSR
ncbi:MAG: ABC transporter ATP-binding protein [Trueperaceae bacterium]